MNIVEKSIIDKIEFTASESKLLKELSDAIIACCKYHSDGCDYCPFDNAQSNSGVGCQEAADFLNYLSCFGVNRN